MSYCNNVAQAVAALLQTDTSAVVTLKSSGIDRPSKLDGKRYASYGARYHAVTVAFLTLFFRHWSCKADLYSIVSKFALAAHNIQTSLALLLDCWYAPVAFLLNNIIW